MDFQTIRSCGKNTMAITHSRDDQDNPLDVISILNFREPNPSFIPILQRSRGSLAFTPLLGGIYLLVCENEKASLYKKQEEDKYILQRSAEMKAGAVNKGIYTLGEKQDTAVMLRQKEGRWVSMSAWTVNEAGEFTEKTVSLSALGAVELYRVTILRDRYLAMGFKNMISIYDGELSLVLHETVFPSDAKEIRNITELSDGRVVVSNEDKIRILPWQAISEIAKEVATIGLFSGHLGVSKIIAEYAATDFSLPDEKAIPQLPSKDDPNLKHPA